MHSDTRKNGSFVSVVILMGLAILCRPSDAVGSSEGTTDKEVYNYGEQT